MEIPDRCTCEIVYIPVAEQDVVLNAEIGWNIVAYTKKKIITYILCFSTRVFLQCVLYGWDCKIIRNTLTAVCIILQHSCRPWGTNHGREWGHLYYYR